MKKKTNEGVRVGFLLRMYPRFSQTFVVNEIRELERQGLEVHIASMRLPDEGMFHESVTQVRAKADYLEQRFVGSMISHLAAQWKLFRAAPRRFRSAISLVMKHRGIALFELCQAAQLIRWARKRRISHVHVHFGTDEADVALLASMLGGPSYSLTLHAFDIFRDNVDRVLLARKINGSRFTVTVCESNRRFILENIPNVDPAKVRVNYNGIDMDEFAPGDEDREAMSVFSVGRLIEKKGFSFLIRAVALLRDRGLKIACRIAGEGRELKALQEQIRSLGLRDHVSLVGAMRQDEVRSAMQRAACFVLPCVQAKDGNVDALPTVLLEAMACGCPTVSTILSGIPEIIENDVSGMLVEVESVERLASAMESILKNPDFAMRLSEGGRRRAVQRFDVSKNEAVMRRWLVAEAGGISAQGEGILSEDNADGKRISEAA